MGKLVVAAEESVKPVLLSQTGSEDPIRVGLLIGQVRLYLWQ